MNTTMKYFEPNATVFDEDDTFNAECINIVKIEHIQTAFEQNPKEETVKDCILTYGARITKTAMRLLWKSGALSEKEKSILKQSLATN